MSRLCPCEKLSATLEAAILRASIALSCWFGRRRLLRRDPESTQLLAEEMHLLGWSIWTAFSKHS